MLPAKGVKERVEGVGAVGQHRGLVGEEDDAALLENGLGIQGLRFYGRLVEDEDDATLGVDEG